MTNLKLIRIDFRLIHGQVMTRWVVKYGIKNIFVIDDSSANNPLLRKILEKSAPSGLDVHVFTINDAIELWKSDKFATYENVLILFKNPQDALEAWNNGLNFNAIQIGSIEGGPDKKNVYKNIVMNEREIDQLKQLAEKNVDVYLQPIPEDKMMSLNSVI